jgi:hypothetical protein
MGVDIFMMPVFKQPHLSDSYAPKNDAENKSFLARSHRINEVVRYGQHSKFLSQDLTFTWLDHLVDLNDIQAQLSYPYPFDWELAIVSGGYVFDPFQILLSIETVLEIMKRENDNLPKWYWFAMDHRDAHDEKLENQYAQQGIKYSSNGISKSREVSALIDGINWKFEGDWDYCMAYPLEEGENSPNKINYASTEHLPIIECYSSHSRSFVDGVEYALKRYQNKDTPDILTIERISYLDSQQPELSHMLDVCTYAIKNDAKICFFVSY